VKEAEKLGIEFSLGNWRKILALKGLDRKNNAKKKNKMKSLMTKIAPQQK
jgi:hypothetical protein